MNAENQNAQSSGLSRRLVLIMATTCGVSIANIYYNQPLLAQMRTAFGATDRQAGLISLVTQLGVAVGMLLFVPLGDLRERRHLIEQVLLGVAGALALVALAPALPLLLVASLFVGLLSVTPHLILPFAAQLAREEERGRAVGSVLSGLLIGILLARTVSGYVGALFGWRAMYGLAALLMIALRFTLRRVLPRSQPTATLTYPETLRSLITLVRTQPILRQAALTGGLLFGAFSAFWTTLVLLLERAPYAYHPASQAAGLFGLVGVVGAGAAPLMGRVADRRHPRLALGLSLLATFLAYAVFLAFGLHLWGLVVGVILLDFGVQAAHVANQTRIYALLPEARSRLNTVYMVAYFVGGALGSSLGAWGWSLARWRGVSLVGLGLVALSIGVHGLARKRN